jgi:DNA polymerase-3 subunit delta
MTEKDLIINPPLVPVYLLFGKQDYLIQLVKQRIINTAMTEDEKDFNLSSYDLLEKPVEAACEDAETLPFIGEKRVVIMENPYFLTSAKPKTKIEQNLKRLEEYVGNPSPDAVMVFVVEAEKLDQRKKLVKTIKQKGKVLELSQLSDGLAFSLLKDAASKYGAIYPKRSHPLLMQRVGFDLQLLVKEVEKLALYSGENQEITEDAVEKLSSRSMESNIFTLTDDILKQESGKALKLLGDLIKQKEEPIKLLALIARQFRIMLQVKKYVQAGYTQKNTAEKLKLHPYSVKLAAEQSRKFEDKDLEDALINCTEMDFQMKTGKIEKQTGLELLIHRLSAKKI